MSRFFRSVRPFFRSISTISTPLCVSFGVASTVPTQSDAPEYVQGVFNTFKHRVTQMKKENDNNQQAIIEEDEEEEPQQQEQQIQQLLNTTNANTTAQTVSQQSQQSNPPTQNRITSKYLSRFIDHTVLKPMSDENSIRKMCTEAIEHNFFSVCCNPCWVSLCKELLKNSNVKICCVVGFPLGSNTTQIKVYEAQQAVIDGADEIDMVMSIGYAKSGYWDKVRNDISEVVDSVGDDISVKVILETCLLTDEEVINACRSAVQAGAKFVKTSTGFAGGGATVHHVALMRRIVDEESIKLGMQVGDILVKASGGIRDSKKAKEMLRAGADRIGASSGIKIIEAHISNDLSSNTTTTQDQY